MAKKPDTQKAWVALTEKIGLIEHRAKIAKQRMISNIKLGLRIAGADLTSDELFEILKIIHMAVGRHTLAGHRKKKVPR